MEYRMSAQQGWQCPICGRVMAPHIPYCPCNGNSNYGTITCTGTSDTQSWVDFNEIKKEIDKSNRYTTYINYATTSTGLLRPSKKSETNITLQN